MFRTTAHASVENFRLIVPDIDTPVNNYWLGRAIYSILCIDISTGLLNVEYKSGLNLILEGILVIKTM